MQPVDLILHSATQLVTCAANPGIIPNGAIAITKGNIVAVGETATILRDYTSAQKIDVSGKILCPGFIDCHTHHLFAGDRVNEFEMKLRGVPYLEILAAGGGIVSTMRATRAATPEQLSTINKDRLQQCLALGTTTIEIKTGYGLSTKEELKCLQTIEAMADQLPLDILPTFLGAHATPPEYTGNTQGYVDLLISETIPAVAQWYSTSSFRKKQPQRPLFIDVYCEKNAFSVEQMDHLFTAATKHGMKPKAHLDQFTSLGGVEVALRHKAISIDHLEVTNDDDISRIAQSSTVAVLLPFANYHLGIAQQANARKLIDRGAMVALATDFNPGSAPCFSIPLVMGLACRMMKMTPAEAMVASTLNAAKALGIETTHGSLEVGKVADLLVLNVADYRHLAYYQGVNFVESVCTSGKMLGLPIR